MTPVQTHQLFGGIQAFYEHDSRTCRSPMQLAVFTPPQVQNAPALIWLSGLTCNEQNFMTKAGAQKLAAQLGLILIAPDTSPRGAGIADDDAYDLGQGAGFYVDATRKPWVENFQMYSYIRDELVEWVCQNLPVNPERIGISGHSMGGHGALILHLKNRHVFKTCSALAPIVAPSQVPWGQKAFTAYLGESPQDWHAYDATSLVQAQTSNAHILIDQGTSDAFLQDQLRPQLFAEAAQKAGQMFSFRQQTGYDHSYYFVASVIEDHLHHHYTALST